MDKRFFEFLTHDERVDCLALGRLDKHPAGTLLLKTGDRPRALFVVLEGEAEVRREDGVVLARLRAADVFGEMSFIQLSAASADVIAFTEVTILTLSEAVVNELVRERPPLAAGLYRSIAPELSRRLVATSMAVRAESSATPSPR